MRARRLACLGGLCSLLLLAGCAGIGSTTSDAALAENATYDWNSSANVSITLEEDEYHAVYEIDNRSSLQVYRSTRYGTDQPIPIRAVQFRYPNGTVVNASNLTVSESRSRVTVRFPADEGQFAFTGHKRSKQFSLPVFIDGSYEVSIPPGHRVDNLVLATVRPRGYETTMVDNRVHVQWEEVASRSITVNYYRGRDLYLLIGLIIVAGIAGAIGITYVWWQIKELRERRREMGLDVDTDDDEFGREPPPGMG